MHVFIKLVSFFFFIAFFSIHSFSSNHFCTHVFEEAPEICGSDSIIKDYVIVNDIEIKGNKVTKQSVIFRELPFVKSDTIVLKELDQKLKFARENLLNTSLFNFVTVDTVFVVMERFNILITVAERWYTWPAPIFEIQERNFNTWWQTKNFKRVNYGFFLNRDNFRGRKEELSFYAQFGYTEKYGITYKIPYLSRKQIGGLGFSFSYSRNHEIGYQTYNNKLIYFKDPDKYVREELQGKLTYSYRSGIHNTHSIDLKYNKGKVSDTVNSYTTDYFIGRETEMQYFVLNYYFKSEFRDSRMYPLNGYFFDFEATHMGFGILPNEKLDVSNLTASFKYYYKISNRFYSSASIKGKYSPDTDQPYYVQKGMGWKDYVRSYEYYVIDGQRYGLAKLGLKYEIIKPRVQAVPFLPLSKFNTFHYALYAGIFSDVGYVSDRQYSLVNPLANSFIYGYGIGIDYVTYYDIVIRMEYSMNKMMEHGFFLHFDAGI